MGQKATSRVELKDFPGLVLNIDPDDLRPGAAREQTNVTSAKPAVLEVRPGFRVVRFDGDTTSRTRR
jgi:hypothetical protein